MAKTHSSLYSHSSPTGYCPLGKNLVKPTRGGSLCLGPDFFLGFFFFFFFLASPPIGRVTK